MEHEIDFIRNRATHAQVIDIFKQRDLALAVVAAAERLMQLRDTPHQDDAEQAMNAALDAYFAHHCRTGERKRPQYDRETGEYR